MADTQRPSGPLVTTIYRVLWPDGRNATDEVQWPEEPTLALIRALVEPLVGGDLEHVIILKPGTEARPEPADMFVNENGHALGLPRNDAATRLYRAAWLNHHPETDPESLSFIVGPAIVFNRRVWT